MGNGWSAGVHRDDFERCIEVYTSHFDARKDFRMQYRLRRHDGAYRWIDDTGSPRIAGDGEFLGYIGPALTSKNNERCSLSCAAICWKMLN
jgi:PAS domain-containing protein